MENIRKIFSQNRFYFLGFIFFFLAGLCFLLCASKAGSFLYMNAYHTQMLNTFFIGYTNLGDGLFTIAIALFMIATRRYEIAWQLLAAFVISGLIAQLLKSCVYSPRPREFFSQKEHIYLVDGITHTGTSSFPSGHSASIFALVTILSLFTKNKRICFFYLMAAILVAYSRIYLSQHFLSDVLAGALIGVTAAMFVYYFFNAAANIRRKRKIEEQEMLVSVVETWEVSRET
jgi:membrane-associated phospholipid phosphatase